MRWNLVFAGLAVAAFVLAGPVMTQAQLTGGAKESAHRGDDVAKHRQMARAHEEAAKCLESKEKESVCHARLHDACKGIAVGKFCGMRHDH